MEVCKALLEVMCKRVIRAVRRIRQKQSAVIITGSLFLIAFLCAVGVSGGSNGIIIKAERQTAAGNAGMGEVFAAETDETEELQAGLMGVVNGAVTMERYSRSAHEIETTSGNGEVLIGAARASRPEVMRNTLEKGTKEARNIGAYATQLVRDSQMPVSEYNTLLRIVEAEATGEDLKGKMLIANVIMNRVNDDRFPNTIEEVVWQQIGGSAQFQPTIDGRIYSVEVTEETIEAVDRVLAGEDYSQGALYFMARMASQYNSVSWFDNNLTLLFQHGGHEYYTLSKEARVS